MTTTVVNPRSEKRQWWEGEKRPMDGPSCPGCGLANYSGLCPVCRGDKDAYDRELSHAFGPWFPEDEDR